MTTTVTFTFVDRCAGGGHFRVDIDVGGASLGRYVYTTDEVRSSLASLPQEDRETVALALMKLHMQGRTRAQMVTEFSAGPVVITI